MIHVEVEGLRAAIELAVALLKLGHKAAVYEDEVFGFHVTDEASNGTLVLVYDPSRKPTISTPRYEGPDRRRNPRIPFRTPVKVSKVREGNA